MAASTTPARLLHANARLHSHAMRATATAPNASNRPMPRTISKGFLQTRGLFQILKAVPSLDERVAPGGAAPATPAGPSPVHVLFGPRTGRGSPATGPAPPVWNRLEDSQVFPPRLCVLAISIRAHSMKRASKACGS